MRHPPKRRGFARIRTKPLKTIQQKRHRSDAVRYRATRRMPNQYPIIVTNGSSTVACRIMRAIVGMMPDLK
ncbi:hypothetical protein CE91St30_11160 [Raoultibacter timonensis]|uniref:Uncharacterized protein n=1 Tax=Raoultibacter timonensis TaxID=1907662 RepID=A0ABM7WHN7_9ACTN|nr:hypothetical protein CE91St30_11160 [Raoultibacter timonensis]BDF50387.1 hypothetical protein CE91St31_11170 [Raoultibacter timonensis]